MENNFIKVVIIILDNGLKIIDTVKEQNIIRMVILNMMVNLLMMNLKEMENIIIQMVIIILDNGLKAKNMAKEYYII